MGEWKAGGQSTKFKAQRPYQVFQEAVLRDFNSSPSYRSRAQSLPGGRLNFRVGFVCNCKALMICFLTEANALKKLLVAPLTWECPGTWGTSQAPGGGGLLLGPGHHPWEDKLPSHLSSIS